MSSKNIKSKEYNELNQLREEIDKIDRQILALLNKRGQIASRVGHIKNSQGLAIYVPSREEEVLSRLKEENQGPFSQDIVEKLFHLIIEESKKIQIETIQNNSQP